MQYFESPQHEFIDIVADDRVTTSLGSLRRRFSCSQQGLVLERGADQIRSSGALVYSWTSSTFRLEELVVAGAIPTPRGPVAVQAILARGEALADGIALTASLEWLPDYAWTECGPCSGQGLEAVTWNDSQHRVTIGTEDAEYLFCRARTATWMPQRLESWFQAICYGNSNSIAVSASEVSLSTFIPPLHRGERVQLQFVVASAPADDDDGTWFAVDSMAQQLLDLAGCR